MYTYHTAEFLFQVKVVFCDIFVNFLVYHQTLASITFQYEARLIFLVHFIKYNILETLWRAKRFYLVFFKYSNMGLLKPLSIWTETYHTVQQNQSYTTTAIIPCNCVLNGEKSLLMLVIFFLFKFRSLLSLCTKFEHIVKRLSP